MRLNAIIILTLSIVLNSMTLSYAAVKYGEKIEKSAAPNQKIILQNMFMVGGLCGSPAPVLSIQSNPKLGSLSSDQSFSKIDLSKNLKGDGHQYCDKETGKTIVYYTAGQSIGVDKFTIAFTHGGADTILIDVTINIGGKKSENIPNNSDIIKTNSNIPIPSNPIFDRIKIGTSFSYSTENLITGKKGNFSLIVSDKQNNEFSAISGPGLIVFNPKFERIKTPEWKYNMRNCDGINYPLVIGNVEKFNHSGIYIKDGANNSRNFSCERKTIGKKTISVMGKPLDGWIIENTHNSKWNNGDNSEYKWVGTFSEEIGTWLEISITEKIEGRTTINLKWELSKYEIPEKEYQIKTTMCSGSCDTAAENQKASILDNKKFKNKNECDQNLNDFGKKETIPVPNPTSFIYACVEAK